MSYESAFFIVPSRIMELPNITLAQVRIYETIFQFWNHGKWCYLSNAAIMDRTNIKSERTIQDALLFFESHNELIRETKNGKRYLCQPTRKLELCDDNDPVDIPTTPAVECGSPPQQSAGTPRSALRHNNKNINNKNINKRYRSSNDDQDQIIINSFDQFWEAYPKKVAKQQAFKVWKKNKLHERLNEILDDLDKRKSANWLNNDKQFIPNPTTYLNGERWNDEIFTEKQNEVANGREKASSLARKHWDLHVKNIRDVQAARESGKDESKLDTVRLDFWNFS